MFIFSTLACLTLLADPAGVPMRESVVPKLQAGGYVLFLRHTQTESDQADTDPLHIENVAAQRQLTAKGKEDAAKLGAALKTLNISFDRILSSQFKRAVDVAEALKLGMVTPTKSVTEGGLVVSPNENQSRAKALRELLGTVPAAGKNTIIVSHRPNLQDAAGKEFGDFQEGEIAIFKPLGAGKFELVARVAPIEVWSTWATAK